MGDPVAGPASSQLSFRRRYSPSQLLRLDRQPMFGRRPPRAFDARTVVTALYASLLGRRPAGGEEMDKVDYLRSGGGIEQVVELILGSDECQLGFFTNAVFDEVTAPNPLPPTVPRLYLWHIPKTGGTSLREMLRPHFDQRLFCGGLTLSQLYRMSHYRLRSFRVIAGHFGPTLPRLLPDVPLVTATVVRDPVDMVASHYVHWRDKGLPGDPLTTLARSMPFEEWCRSQDTYGLWSNPQATSLCSERVPPDRSQAETMPEGTAIPVPEDELAERATATLAGIDEVGPTDDLLGLYRACLARLGVTPRLQEALSENVGARMSAPISESTREWLLEHNQVDVTLYAAAKSRLAPDSSGSPLRSC